MGQGRASSLIVPSTLLSIAVVLLCGAAADGAMACRAARRLRETDAGALSAAAARIAEIERFLASPVALDPRVRAERADVEAHLAAPDDEELSMALAMLLAALERVHRPPAPDDDRRLAYAENRASLLRSLAQHERAALTRRLWLRPWLRPLVAPTLKSSRRPAEG